LLLVIYKWCKNWIGICKTGILSNTDKFYTNGHHGNYYDIINIHFFSFYELWLNDGKEKQLYKLLFKFNKKRFIKVFLSRNITNSVSNLHNFIKENNKEFKNYLIKKKNDIFNNITLFF